MKNYHKILIFIFLITLGFRLFFVFQTPYYSSDDAYYNIRYTEAINENYKPMLYDDLSYGGRDSVTSPVYHYFMAALNAVIPHGLAFKIIPEILLAGLAFIIFFIARSITNNVTAALLSALIGGFVPIFIHETLNQVSIYSLILVLLFYCVYALLNLKTHLHYFIVLAFLLPLLHPIGSVLGVAFLIYVLLLSIESIRIKQLTKEAVYFFIFIAILVNLILFKKVFLSLGLLAVWQNIPNELLINFFKNVSVLDLIAGMGVVPLILGIMGFFFGVFRERKNAVYLLSSMILTMLILLLLKLISFAVGVMILGLLMTIMSALTLEKIIAYIKLTKFSKYKKVIFTSFIILIVLTLCIPAYIQARDVVRGTITEDEVESLNWIRYNTPGDSIVLASVEEGNYIAAIAKRKNVADSLFLLAPDRYSDVSTIFNTESLVVATQLLDKYDVDYIYLSDRAKEAYGIINLKYVGDENCFKEVYKTDRTRVYKVLC